mmetsp:Transcript_55254/g.131728  ORF Transcript_55254/g.131728 Transcript_55254/m.131728 type:complete len:458 (+) Transcript_55254:34-1407(+)
MPLSQLVQNAVKSGANSLTLHAAVDEQRSALRLPAVFSITGSDVLLSCHSIAVDQPPPSRKITTKGKPPGVLLKGLHIKGGSANGAAAIDVLAGGVVTMIDCELESEGVGIRLAGAGSTVMLQNVGIKAKETGIEARAGTCVRMEGSHIACCGADGLWLDAPERVTIEGASIMHNTRNGILLARARALTGASKPCLLVQRSTITQNSQYGIWADMGASATCQQSFLEENVLGSISGAGAVEVQEETFEPESKCYAWLEEEAGGWHPCTVLQASSTGIEVCLDTSGAKTRRLPKKVSLPRSALRTLHYNQPLLPPLWSKHDVLSPPGEYQHFLRLLGLERGDASTRQRFKEESLESKQAKLAAKRDRAKNDALREAVRRARLEAGRSSAPCEVSAGQALVASRLPSQLLRKRRAPSWLSSADGSQGAAKSSRTASRQPSSEWPDALDEMIDESLLFGS